MEDWGTREERGERIREIEIEMGEKKKEKG